ncbi:hypothetical protein PHYPSEUDO_003384 [Phytophthora pseudosyringae]|uniref:Uncharacterized protein n=1 Tax=Phytophthora pseudosyringae TaxID=221518 RepID=A0A8T1VQR3_9STRA|nr:hypothetical protein PHYPSEUDO_003384 [Phytophthora pseudosyringae]
MRAASPRSGTVRFIRWRHAGRAQWRPALARPSVSAGSAPASAVTSGALCPALWRKCGDGGRAHATGARRGRFGGIGQADTSVSACTCPDLLAAAAHALCPVRRCFSCRGRSWRASGVTRCRPLQRPRRPGELGALDASGERFLFAWDRWVPSPSLAFARGRQPGAMPSHRSRADALFRATALVLASRATARPRRRAVDIGKATRKAPLLLRVATETSTGLHPLAVRSSAELASAHPP